MGKLEGNSCGKDQEEEHQASSCSPMLFPKFILAPDIFSFSAIVYFTASMYLRHDTETLTFAKIFSSSQRWSSIPRRFRFSPTHLNP